MDPFVKASLIRSFKDKTTTARRTPNNSSWIQCLHAALSTQQFSQNRFQWMGDWRPMACHRRRRQVGRAFSSQSKRSRLWSEKLLPTRAAFASMHAVYDFVQRGSDGGGTYSPQYPIDSSYLQYIGLIRMYVTKED